jgi:hypothetical protein
MGSYRFELQFEAPVQLDLPLFEQQPTLSPDRLADAFFEVIDAVSSASPEDLSERIPDERYRVVLAKLVRNLVPDGRELTEVEIRRSQVGDRQAAVLRPELRKVITRRLASGAPSPKVEASRTGVLRALHLDQGWIMLAEKGEANKYRIAEGRIFDDVVGPLVNRRVTVDGYGRGRNFVVTDIQLETDEPEAFDSAGCQA